MLCAAVCCSFKHHAREWKVLKLHTSSVMAIESFLSGFIFGFEILCRKELRMFLPPVCFHLLFRADCSLCSRVLISGLASYLDMSPCCDHLEESLLPNSCFFSSIVVLKLGSPNELQFPEAFTTFYAGQDFWKLQSQEHLETHVWESLFEWMSTIQPW